MNPSEIAKSYDRIADLWNNDTFPRKNGIEQHERALAFLRNKRYALDIGCGCSGRFIDLLIGHGFHAEGIDLSQRMIELARQRHPNINFYQADLCEWNFPRKYDFISAWDSLWHIPLQEQAPVLKKILRSLEPGGIFIFTMGGLDEPGEKVDDAMGPTMYYSTLGIPNILRLLAEAGCLCRHLEYDQYPEPHVYIIAQNM
jgi:SAM-dependent methyltransferase